MSDAPEAAMEQRSKIARQPATPPTATGETVTVACKMPSGLVLRIFDWYERPEPVLGGGTRMVRMSRRRPEEYTINGAALDPFRLGFPDYRVVGGYALTPGIPRDFWDRWYEDNKNSDLVKNNVIFAWKSSNGAFDKAREQEEVRSGLEPIDPDNLRNDVRLPGDVRRKVRRDANPGQADPYNDADNL